MEPASERGEERSNAEPARGEVISEQLLVGIPLSGGDCIRIKWLRMSRGWPVLSIWFYKPADGTWLPIRNRGIRVLGHRVRMLLDAVNAAAPFEAEWRRYKN